ncbi:MAG: hypothetical protein KAR32_02300 [Candidatus Omnitrophica bacterium]|nr:hypothetical protein [Candidatus Omnitrophota bacterium]MCK5259492.1 hypothetical protein [Candidatus Omnitrophota bacterium]
MNRRVLVAGSLIFFFVLTVPAKANSGLLEVAKDKLKEKTVQSGTLDIYDEGLNRVRNLRLMKVSDVVEKDGAYLITADYRDIGSGDIVGVEADMVSASDDFIVKDARIKSVQAIDEGEAEEYTDDEIQAFMTEYIEKQGKFTGGKVMLFDKDNEKMRHLELTELKAEVRRMGIFYSSSSKFVDVDTNDIVDIDISVENKKGKLKVQALRIRNVRKGLVGKDVSP